MPVFLIFLAGIGAGSVGAMLGLGGGILLVPILNIGLGLPIGQATALSLITVISTSNFVSLTSAGRRFANVRLALMLQVFSVAGAITGTVLLDYISPSGQEQVFGATAVLVAIVMLSRLNSRNVLHGEVADLGVLGARIDDPDTGVEVAYRVRRLPLALGVAGGAGVVSTLAGVGGGVLIVPALNSWCGVPMRAAAATSAAILGVTALPGVVDNYARGNLTESVLAAAAVLGAIVGSRVGFWCSRRVKVKSLKVFMALVLAFVAVEYIFYK